MKRTKKNLKGMTLYEMIISIAIFAIMCGVLIGVGMHIDNSNKATNNLKAKINAEAPYAANRVEDPRMNKDVVKIDVKCGAGSVELEYEKYATADILVDSNVKNSSTGAADGPNSGLNLEFLGENPIN